MKNIVSKFVAILLAAALVLTSAVAALANTDAETAANTENTVNGDTAEIPAEMTADELLEVNEDADNAVAHSPVIYEILFDDGIGTILSFDVKSGESINAPAAPSRDDYKFNGWRFGNSTYQAGESIIVTGAMSFNAVWEAIPHVHKYGDWKVTVKATYFKSGKKVRECRCGLTQTKKIPKKKAKSKWVKDNGKRYYFNKKGKIVKGWHKIKFYKGSAVKWCWFDKKGVYKKSVSKNTRRTWVKAGGKKYYFTRKKRPGSKGFIMAGGKLYYLDKNGAAKIGTFKAEGIRFTTAGDGSISGLAYLKYKYRTFVLVDISEQKLRFYKRGKLKMKADVVTGTKGRHDTPTGTFSIRSKQRNIYLNGSTWSSHVDYWMAFIGSSYGLHDATWRSSSQFSNHRTYINNGSHGCINMRHSDAADLYYMVSWGTTVIVQP